MTTAPALKWRDPMITVTIGGGADGRFPGRINPAGGALDSTFYQRIMAGSVARCRALGCAPRVMFRETFGHWSNVPKEIVDARGYELCPPAMRASWGDLVASHGDYEIIEYPRHGEGQYPTNARGYAEAAHTNLVQPLCNGAGAIVASKCLDGLPEVKKGTVAAHAIHGLHALIRETGSLAGLYSEAFPEQHTADAYELWGHLPAMSTWENLRDNPPRRVERRAERIAIDCESTTAEQCAAFFRFCAERAYTPMVYDATFPGMGKTVREIQVMAGRVIAAPGSEVNPMNVTPVPRAGG